MTTGFGSGPRERRLAGVVAGSLVACAALLRRRLLTWGERADEVRMNLAGDAILPGASMSATRAVGIAAPPDDVWPWIAQLGQGRGGFYSYDRLENSVGCRIHSADRVVAEWQRVGVGDKVNLHPDVGLVVAEVDPGRALVLRGGVPMGGRPAPYDFTWAFVLLCGGHGTTRLVVRERYRYARWWAALLVEPVELVSFVMSQKMLRGIRDRAETGQPHQPNRVGRWHPARRTAVWIATLAYFGGNERA